MYDQIASLITISNFHSNKPLLAATSFQSINRYKIQSKILIWNWRCYWYDISISKSCKQLQIKFWSDGLIDWRGVWKNEPTNCHFCIVLDLFSLFWWKTGLQIPIEALFLWWRHVNSEKIEDGRKTNINELIIID